MTLDFRNGERVHGSMNRKVHPVLSISVVSAVRSSLFKCESLIVALCMLALALAYLMFQGIHHVMYNGEPGAVKPPMMWRVRLYENPYRPCMTTVSHLTVASA